MDEWPDWSWGAAHHSRYLRMEDVGLQHLLDVPLSYWENGGKCLAGAR